MAAGDVYEAAVYYNVGGELSCNVLHFADKGGTDAMALATEMRDGWMATMAGILGQDTFYNRVTVLQKVHVGSPDQAELAVNVPGLKAPGSIVPQLAACFSIKTAQYSKSGRGRWYQGGVSSIDETGARLSAGAISGDIATAIAAITAKYIGDSASSNYKLGVFSRKNFSLLTNPLTASFTDATSISVHSVLSTMRSRKPVT